MREWAVFTLTASAVSDLGTRPAVLFFGRLCWAEVRYSLPLVCPGEMLKVRIGEPNGVMVDGDGSDVDVNTWMTIRFRVGCP